MRALKLVQSDDRADDSYVTTQAHEGIETQEIFHSALAQLVTTQAHEGIETSNDVSCIACVLSIENPQNRKENSPLSDREIPIIRKKHVESFRFFTYLVGKKAAFTAFCPIG